MRDEAACSQSGADAFTRAAATTLSEAVLFGNQRKPRKFFEDWRSMGSLPVDQKGRLGVSSWKGNASSGWNLGFSNK